MLPPMKEKAVISFPDTTQPRDRYGKYPVTEQTIKANVRISTKVVEQADGVSRQAQFKVVIPPIPVENGQAIRVQDKFNLWHNATILEIEDAENFGGNRVIYRNLHCAK